MTRKTSPADTQKPQEEPTSLAATEFYPSEASGHDEAASSHDQASAMTAASEGNKTKQEAETLKEEKAQGTFESTAASGHDAADPLDLAVQTAQMATVLSKIDAKQDRHMEYVQEVLAMKDEQITVMKAAIRSQEKIAKGRRLLMEMNFGKAFVLPDNVDEIDLHQVDESGMSILHHAARMVDPGLVRKILQMAPCS